MNSLSIPWLAPLSDRWQEQQRHGRAPHAVILLGAPGVGKRALAAWLVQRMLQPDTAAPAPQYPVTMPQLPDFYWLQKPEDKHTIGIDLVRQLIAELGLTSHDGRGKAAVIEPANIMTTAAANSLLKTLEEPPGDALLILVADRLGRLPATILSRCQRITIPVPATQDSLAWLDALQPGNHWPEALREAGGAPLAAVAALDQLADAGVMARDLQALAAGAASPVEVAARWVKDHQDVALDWLGRQVEACIRRRAAGPAAGSAAVLDDSVLQRIDSRNLFCYLDIINRLRGQASGSFNPQLTLEGLLIDWKEGLVHCRQQDTHGGLWPLSGTR